MVAELAKTLLEFLKLPQFIVAGGIAAAILLFASDQFIRRLGLTELVQRYRFVLGLTLVLSVAIVAVYGGQSVFRMIKGWWRTRRFHIRVIKRLHNLTEDEKQILRYYLANNTRANMLRFDDGVVQGLVDDGIIYRSASLGNLVEGFAHNINDFVWDYLHGHGELLRGNTNFYRTDKSGPNSF